MTNAHIIIGGASGGAPTGPAGGDLSGTYPNPNVITLTGDVTGASSLSVGAIPADAGHYRLPFNGEIRARKASNDGDIGGIYFSGGDLYIGSYSSGPAVFPNNIYLRTTGDTVVNDGPLKLPNGDIRIGTVPATSGAVRLGNNAPIVAREVNNTANIELIRLGTDNWIYVGYSQTSAAGMAIGGYGDTQFYAGGAYVLSHAWDGSKYVQQMNSAYNHSFHITPTGVGSATGKTLTIQGQNCTGTTTTGGNLVLAPGTGTSTNGDLHWQNMKIDISAPPSGSTNVPTQCTGFVRIVINGVARRIAIYDE